MCDVTNTGEIREGWRVQLLSRKGRIVRVALLMPSVEGLLMRESASGAKDGRSSVSNTIGEKVCGHLGSSAIRKPFIATQRR